MALFIRIGVTKFINSSNCKILAIPSMVQMNSRSITTKAVRCMKENITTKPEPWPYEKKRFTFLKMSYDKTSKRFDENSKIIVVEGPVAAGKTKVAKKLAEELDMLYLPEANLDMYYTNAYGYDMKNLDPQLPESCRSFDVENFLLNPKHKSTASFQFSQFEMKYSQYIDALAHVFSTGQGVVLDRCVYSDFVFLEAMYSHGYVSRAARAAYYDVRKNCIDELLRPHLIIYLDTSVDNILRYIKKRNITCEVKSPVLTKDYLAVMEKYYKQEYLTKMSEHSELLIYDWSEDADEEIVVEDIERIDFDKYGEYDKKLADWIFYQEYEYKNARIKYADRKKLLYRYLNVPYYQVPELVVTADDMEAFREVWDSAPGMEYAEGYNERFGDGGNLFKSTYDRGTLPRIERKLGK